MPSDGPKYALGSLDDPSLRDQPPLVRAQVTQAIMQQLLTEVVDYACGGEVILPPGFRERIGGMKRTIETKFLADDSYRVVAVQMPTGIIFLGQGTRWEREEKGDLSIYEVVEEDRSADGSGYTALQRVGEENLPVGMVVSVRTSLLRNRAGGWRPWRYSPRMIEEAPSGG